VQCEDLGGDLTQGRLFKNLSNAPYSGATLGYVKCPIVDFQWICPSCLTACMPFHDCSALSFTEDFDCSNSSLHEDFYISINSPVLTQSFLLLAHLNRRNLLCKLDEVLSFCDVNTVDNYYDLF